MAVAMSVNYYTVNGMILAEDRGGVYSEFVPDTLGSCVAVKDVSENITYTADYWPHGEVRNQTGSKSATWGFVGLRGYLTDTAKRLYVRARQLRVDLGQWMTVDPFWPGQPKYSYVQGSPVLQSDPSGLIAPQIIAAIIAAITSCVASALSSIVGGWFSGDSLPVAACKAGVKCVTGAIRSALTALIGPVAGCIAAIVGSLVNLVADKLCPCISNPCCDKHVDWCDAAKATADSAMGCLGGIAQKEFVDSFGDWLGGFLNSVINGITRSTTGKACKGAVELHHWW